MNTTGRICARGASGLVVLSLCLAFSGVFAQQAPAPGAVKASDTAGFREFSERVQALLKLQKTIEAGLPALKSTDLPEMIAAYQQARARRIQEARPNAKAGNLFTPAACEAFRRASRASVEGTDGPSAPLEQQQDDPNQAMRLVVNGIYPDTEPRTTFSPALLAAFPPLPADLAYRIVGRTLLVVDVKSRVIIDVAHLILPPG
jgi:hypothetical protein